MPTIFSRIIDGELPGRFVYRDEQAVGFLSIAPLRPGHTLIVPVAEIDHWIDAPPELNQHLIAVAQKVALAQQQAFSPTRVALIIAGLEVPHVHLHVIPIASEADLHFERAEQNPDPAALDAAADAIRHALGTDAADR